MRIGTWLRERLTGPRKPNAECRVCGQPVWLYPNHYNSMGGGGTIPRPPEELIAACRDQNGTRHTIAEMRAAAERDHP